MSQLTTQAPKFGSAVLAVFPAFAFAAVAEAAKVDTLHCSTIADTAAIEGGRYVCPLMPLPPPPQEMRYYGGFVIHF